MRLTLGCRECASTSRAQPRLGPIELNGKPRNPSFEPTRVTSWVPMFMLIWFSPSSFLYETPYGGAEKSPAGRSVVRLSTLAQALAFGKKLEAGIGRPGGFSYSVVSCLLPPLLFFEHTPP